MSETILAWHFLEATGCTRDEAGYPPPVQVEVGQTLTESRPLVLCHVGLHASVKALDALRYAPGPVVCRVRMGGACVTNPAHPDKLCYSQRTVLAMADATDLLHEFACWCAEAALTRERESGREPDARAWAAIAAKRAWLRQEIDDDQLAAAWAAARAAARAAASAADSYAASAAAWDAANADAVCAASDAALEGVSYAATDAATDAASYAATDAALDAASYAASYSAWDAAWDVQNEELERRLIALLGLNEEKKR
jgi:hypothetical protein